MNKEIWDFNCSSVICMSDLKLSVYNFFFQIMPNIKSQYVLFMQAFRNASEINATVYIHYTLILLIPSLT